MYDIQQNRSRKCGSIVGRIVSAYLLEALTLYVKTLSEYLERDLGSLGGVSEA